MQIVDALQQFSQDDLYVDFLQRASALQLHKASWALREGTLLTMSSTEPPPTYSMTMKSFVPAG